MLQGRGLILITFVRHSWVSFCLHPNLWGCGSKPFATAQSKARRYILYLLWLIYICRELNKEYLSSMFFQSIFQLLKWEINSRLKCHCNTKTNKTRTTSDSPETWWVSKRALCSRQSIWKQSRRSGNCVTDSLLDHTS